MKPICLIAVFLLTDHLPAADSGPYKSPDERYIVTFVEPADLPDLAALPAYFPDRESVIEYDQAAVKRGEKREEIEARRRLYLRQALFPIRVVDAWTGIVYEVASDRRTVTARKSNGDQIWKVDPFKDANLKPYRSPHPYICYFGKSTNSGGLKVPILGIAYSSSQFGDIELETGKFHFGGQD